MDEIHQSMVLKGNTSEHGTERGLIMSNKVKMLMVISSVFLICVFLSGCFYSTDGRRVTAREGLEEVVFIYLNNKYGTDNDFRIVKTRGGGSTGVGLRTAYISSNKLPDDTLFTMDVNNIKLDSNKYGFEVVLDSDNYIETLNALPLRIEMLQRLGTKYGREFIPISFSFNSGWVTGNDTFTLACYPSDGDPEYDYTVIKGEDDGNVISYQDTFFGNIIRSEIEANIFNLLSSLSYPYMVTYRVGGVFYDDSFNGSNTLDDLFSWISDNDPDWNFEVEILVWVQFSDDIDIGYFRQFDPYKSEMYDLLCVLEHEYWFSVGVAYNEKFSAETWEASNVSVYHRSDFVISIFVNSELEYIN